MWIGLCLTRPLARTFSAGLSLCPTRCLPGTGSVGLSLPHRFCRRPVETASYRDRIVQIPCASETRYGRDRVRLGSGWENFERIKKCWKLYKTCTELKKFKIQKCFQKFPYHIPTRTVLCHTRSRPHPVSAVLCLCLTVCRIRSLPLPVSSENALCRDRIKQRPGAS